MVIDLLEQGRHALGPRAGEIDAGGAGLAIGRPDDAAVHEADPRALDELLGKNPYARVFKMGDGPWKNPALGIEFPLGL